MNNSRRINFYANQGKLIGFMFCIFQAAPWAEAPPLRSPRSSFQLFGEDCLLVFVFVCLFVFKASTGGSSTPPFNYTTHLTSKLKASSEAPG